MVLVILLSVERRNVRRVRVKIKVDEVELQRSLE